MTYLLLGLILFGIIVYLLVERDKERLLRHEKPDEEDWPEDAGISE